MRPFCCLVVQSGRIMVLKVDESLIFLTNDRSLDLRGKHLNYLSKIHLGR